MRTSQLLVFKLGDEIFGIYMSDVQGVESYREPTKIPGAPDYIEGIIALRGDVIVAINLKKIFNLGNPIITADSRIIVVNSEEIQIGFIVDEASEALSSDICSFEQVSDIISKVNINYIEGIKKYKGKQITILGLESIVREIEI